MPSSVEIPFFVLSRNGFTFVLEDEIGDPIVPGDIWDSVEVAIYGSFDYYDPIVVLPPYIDSNIISLMFTNEEIEELFSEAEYRIEIRGYSGGGYEPIFYYKVNLKNLYQ